MKILSKTCQKIESFQIKLAHFIFFQHSKENCTLWLASKPDNSIVDPQNHFTKISN